MERVCKHGTGRIVGKRVQFGDGDFGTVLRYDRIDKVFVVEMEDDKYKSKFNPYGIVYAERESFTVLN